MDYIITTEHLTKKYKNFTSVNHVSLHIRMHIIYCRTVIQGDKIYLFATAAGWVRPATV